MIIGKTSKKTNIANRTCLLVQLQINSFKQGLSNTCKNDIFVCLSEKLQRLLFSKWQS